MDVAVFGYFDPVLEKKAFDVDEFDPVDERVFELVVQTHFFVGEDVVVDPQLRCRILGRKVSREVGQFLLDVGISGRKGVFFNEDITPKLDMAGVVPVRIGGGRDREFGMNLFPEPVFVEGGIERGHAFTSTAIR